MWIVRLALRRPYTFVVMAILIAILGGLTILRMPTDIFPEINIPVVAVVWNYQGLPPDELNERIVSNYERALTTTVNDIQHIESQTLFGVSVVKVFFQPGARIEAATAQVTAISQTVLKSMPVGTTPPLVMQYSASNVPILQAVLNSPTLSEQQVFDLTNNFLRTGLTTVQGAQLPFAWGGKVRQIMVDLDLPRLYALGLSPGDISSVLNSQNLALPTGTAKIGDNEYPIRLNSSPDAVDALNDLPVKTVGTTTVKIRDVAHVRDGFIPQTSIVHADGGRAVLQSILKAAGSSTLDIVARVRAALPAVLAQLPKDLHVALLFDQSVFVRAAVEGVIKEASLAALLTALMILLFLGSWRSTLIVVVSIPLSILVSLIVLAALGETINTMTLGGLALAVGILVDDATVEIENVHRNLGQKKPLVKAILDGAAQIATPAFVSTLSICIVFVPVAFLTGAAKSLFMPLGLAVVFAMLMSYFLSRTLVPTMVHFLLGAEVERYQSHGAGPAAKSSDFIWAIHGRFNEAFEWLRRRYGLALAWALANYRAAMAGFLAFVVLSACLYPLLGRDFFPAVDAGQIKLHVRGPPGTRIEQTERNFGRVEDTIRQVIPPGEIAQLIDNIGIPNSGINLALSDGSLISAADGEILLSLTDEHHLPTAEYVKRLRRVFADQYPGFTFFFLPPDISTQVLNFGISAPIDIQLMGPLANQDQNMEIARRIRSEVERIPGAVDVHLQQVVSTPEFRVDVDRTRASQVGLNQVNVANDVLVSLSSSGQVAPNFWVDHKHGVQYNVSVQTPQYRVDSLQALDNTPIADGQQLLGNLATMRRDTAPTNVTHYNATPTVDVQANVQGTDLGSVSDAIDRLLAKEQPNFPRGTTAVVRGQVESMNASFRGLGFGILFAVLLVYFLMVVNFQSWIDPLIILMALPGALAGILWMLFVTQTTVSVPSLMGAIMSIGVATSNSILMITFANDQRAIGRDAHDSALAAGMTRLRPVMMTALAMIIGMLPMSLGFGEGGEQNAPLGRAVIGGLLLATFATLFFVPVVYSRLRRKAWVHHTLEDEMAEELVHG